MGSLTQGFGDAHSRITASESAYSPAATSLRAAVGAVPERVDRIFETLNGYLTASASVGESELKEAADDLFRNLNQSFSVGNVTIATALPVS